MDTLPLRHRSDRATLRAMSLQSRFMIAFAIVVVALITMVILLVGHRQSRSLLSQQKMRGEAVAKSIAAVIINPLLSYDYPSLQRAADDAREDTGISYVVVLDKEGKVAGYSNQPELQGLYLDDEISKQAAAADGPFIQHIAAGNHPMIGAAVLDIAAPIFVGNSPVQWGTIRVGLDLEAMEAELATTRRDLGLLGIFAVIVVLLSARFLTARLTRPMKELAEATAKIASGDLDHLVNEDLVGELGDLARSFNKMTFDLKRSRDAIRYQNQHLENMIQERTAALRQKARELEKANEELKEVDRLKSDFLSNVSHELRTPLTSIRSFTEIMLDPDMHVAEDEQMEFLAIVNSQASRLTRLISDLLDLSKIEAGEFNCRILPVDIQTEVVHPVVETLRGIAGDKGVELINDMPLDLPKAAGDADRISQVVTNLVDNAIKFTPEGGHVRVSARVCDRRTPEGQFAGMASEHGSGGLYLWLEVSDSGAGIAPADQRKIFEKFGQVGNVLTDKPQGTGLGLAISGSIMVQHGGALWVESMPKEGATFFVALPLSTSGEQMRTESGRIIPISEKIQQLGKLVGHVHRVADSQRVLIVDDDEQTRQILTGLFESEGMRPFCANGTSQALDQARELRPGCIILDLDMPGLDGIDALRIMQSDPELQNIPIIVLGEGEKAERALGMGARTALSKNSFSAPEGVLV